MNISKSLSRAGTCSKIVYYSHSKSDNRFEYQNQEKLNYNPSIELKGTLHRPKTSYSVNKQNNIDKFRKMSIKNLPDSKRTIIPSLNNESENENKELKIQNKIKKNNNNPNFLKSNIFIFNEEINNQKLRHINERNSDSDIFNLKKYENLNQIPKRILHYNEFHKYTDTTQVYNLPGGKKRIETDIKDDEKYLKLNKRRNESHKVKMNSDYLSNVSCLYPSNHSQREEKLKGKFKNYNLNQTFNIFDTEYYSIKTKEEKESKCKSNNIKKDDPKSFNFFNHKSTNKENNFNSNYSKNVYFINAHQPSMKEKKLIPHPKQKILGIRNPFISQIKIN